MVKIKDEPIRGKGVTLRITKRRLWCRLCKKPFMQYIGGISKRAHTTQRYKRAVLWASENFSNLTLVKKAYRCSDGYLYKAVYEMLDLRRRRRLYPWPKVFGIDEHSFRRYKLGKIGWVTSIVDIKNHRLYEVCEGKSVDELKSCVQDIPGRQNVRYVAMDMSVGYESFVKDLFPLAEIVIDKFHVLRLFTKAINRKCIDITGDKRRHPIRGLLLRSSEDLESYESRVLWQWLGLHDDVRELYEFKERMRMTYRIKGYNRARRSFGKLLDQMGSSQQASVQVMRQTLVSWSRGILAYFKTGLTNSMSEGFNNKAKLVQRMAFGLRSFEHYRLRLLNACA